MAFQFSMKCSREQEILPLLEKKKQDCYVRACMKMMHSTCTPAEALTKLKKRELATTPILQTAKYQKY
jgi:hypothetical protein